MVSILTFIFTNVFSVGWSLSYFTKHNGFGSSLGSFSQLFPPLRFASEFGLCFLNSKVNFSCTISCLNTSCSQKDFCCQKGQLFAQSSSASLPPSKSGLLKFPFLSSRRNASSKLQNKLKSVRDSLKKKYLAGATMTVFPRFMNQTLIS